MSGRMPKRSTRRTTGTTDAAPAMHAARDPRPCTATWPGIDRAATDWLHDVGLFTPLGYEPGYDYPLLVWLTDPTAPGPAFNLGRVMRRLSLRNFLAVQPAFSATVDVTGRQADGRCEEDVWRAIDLVRARASVHPDRSYLVGPGTGGSDAFRIACRHPRSFAGVVSLGGRFPLSESLFARLRDVRRLPMLLCCHRTEPDAAGHTDRTLRLFHAAGAMLAMRIYPGSNALSRSILGDVNRWLMDEVCGTQKQVQSHCVR